MVMPLAHSVIVSWIGACVFMVLLSLKLESKGSYSWFVVFVPLFVGRCIDLVWLLVRIISHARSNEDPRDVSMKRKIWYVIGVLLEVLFEILLCLRLDEIIPDLKLYYALIPFWILLVGNMINFFHFQIAVVRSS